MIFSKITIEDMDTIADFLSKAPNEISCDATFVNLLIWQEKYGNTYAVQDGQLFMKIDKSGDKVFALPFGGNMADGLSRLNEYLGGDLPVFHAQEGGRLEEFRRIVGDKYIFEENRNDFDYIYSQKELAELSGKKYHGKRNHIASFSKKFAWRYERIIADNLEDIRNCAYRWYDKNNLRDNIDMRIEEKGILLLLDNWELLKLTGGCIFADGEIAAFTIGTPINNEIFDIHIEKALPEYPGAYNVINCEFARELSAFKYINREEDLGLEGLRRAKLSYYPIRLVKKYFCHPAETVL
jgi:hypothetical protein